MARWLLSFWGLCCVCSQTIEFDDPNLETVLLTRRWHNEAGFFPIDLNSDGRISVQEALEVRGSVSVYRKSISSLGGMEFFENMTSFDCSYNDVTTVEPLANLGTLRILYASGNPIRTLTGIPHGLEGLSLDYTELAGHQFLSDFPNLTRLHLSRNQIDRLEVVRTPKLVHLYLSGNRLTQLAIDSVNSLRRVFVTSNALTSLPSLPSGVDYLDIGYNQIRELDGLPRNLRVLNVRKNRIESDEFVTRHPQLISLIISNNALTSISNIAAHPTLGTSRGIDCFGIPVGCSETHYLTMDGNFLSEDDCTDMQTILEKAPNPFFPVFGYKPVELCSNLGITMWVPHLTRVDGGFQSSLVITNHGDSNALVDLVFYSEAGLALSNSLVEIASHEHVRLYSYNWDMGSSHIEVTAPAHVSLAVGYGSLLENSLAHVPMTRQFGHLFSFLRGATKGEFEGVAVVNTSDETCSWQVEYYDEDNLLIGDPISQQEILPKGKSLMVVSNELEGQKGSIVLLKFSKPVVVTYLKGTPPGVSPEYLYDVAPIDVK